MRFAVGVCLLWAIHPKCGSIHYRLMLVALAGTAVWAIEREQRRQLRVRRFATSQ
jgi:hypothetical protein